MLDGAHLECIYWNTADYLSHKTLPYRYFKEIGKNGPNCVSQKWPRGQ